MRKGKIILIAALLTAAALICTLAFAVAAGIWMFGFGTSQDALHILSIGLTFLLLPRIADWVVEKATDLGTTLVAFLLG